MLPLATNWKDYYQQIKTLVRQNIESHFNDHCYTALKKQVTNIRKSRDLDFDVTKSFEHSLGIPLVLPVIFLRRAILSQAFRPDYLFYFSPLDGTPWENAKIMESLVNANLISTKFKKNTFRRTLDSLASYGNAVIYSEFLTKQSASPQIVSDGNGMIQMVDTPQIKANAHNHYVHICDYFQDPKMPTPDDSEYQGFINRMYTHSLIAHVNQFPGMYDEAAVKRLMERTVQKGATTQWHHSNVGINKNNTDIGKLKNMLDIFFMYAKLPIQENEDDDTDYQLIVDNNFDILSLVKNPNLHYRRMISVLNYFPREEYWWGINEAIIIRPHEGIKNFIINLQLNNAIQSMNYKILYPDTMDIDPKDMEQMMYIPYRPQMNADIRAQIWQFQPVDKSGPVVDSTLANIHENMQAIVPKPDFTKTPGQGGMGNASAQAVQNVTATQNTLETDILNEVALALSEVGTSNYMLLQRYLEREFNYQPVPQQDMVTVFKEQILGEYHCECKTALTENKLIRLGNLKNDVTWFINNMGTGHPDFQRVPLMPYIKEIIRNSDIGNEREIMDILNQQARMPFQTEQPQMAVQQPTGGAQ